MRNSHSNLLNANVTEATRQYGYPEVKRVFAKDTSDIGFILENGFVQFFFLSIHGTPE